MKNKFMKFMTSRLMTIANNYNTGEAELRMTCDTKMRNKKTKKQFSKKLIETDKMKKITITPE